MNVKIISKKLAVALLAMTMSALPSMNANAQGAAGTILGVSTTAAVTAVVVAVVFSVAEANQGTDDSPRAEFEAGDIISPDTSGDSAPTTTTTTTN